MKLLRVQLDSSISLLKNQDSYKQVINGIFTRCRSQWANANVDGPDRNGSGGEEKEASSTATVPVKTPEKDVSKYSSDDLRDNKWNLELDWLTKALEPALQLYRRALPLVVNADERKSTPRTRSVSEIISSIQRSKLGIQDWSLSDLTVGLYLIYVSQASANKVEDIKGIQITDDSIVQDLIYHVELAKGAYRENAAGLARNSMLREQNVLKFIKDSSVMRPGYYIGTDIRNKLVILGIRGTHTVYDIITDIVSSSAGEVKFDDYSAHFGTGEAARWFLHHEMGTIRKCLEKHEGFRLRLVGHSLGGAAASLLAIMLRNKTKDELGFSPDIVSAVGVATPPCLSKELAESCSSYVSTVVLQDDIIPRLSVASLKRLRNEILQTDWMTVLEKEDWKSVVDVVTNAKQVVSSVQDAARKLADYANFKSKMNPSDASTRKESAVLAQNRRPAVATATDQDGEMPELFLPGTLYFLKRDVNDISKSNGSSSTKGRESYTLWKRHVGEHFEKIVLSSNFISDHKCDNHYYALRDVLKGLPSCDHRGITDR